jgi:hypothetical protein
MTPMADPDATEITAEQSIIIRNGTTELLRFTRSAAGGLNIITGANTIPFSMEDWEALSVKVRKLLTASPL